MVDQNWLQISHKDLSLSGKPSPPDVCHVGGLSVPPPALLQLPGHNPPSCSCLGPLTQVAQPVNEAQTLRPDEGGGEVLPNLVHNDPQLLIQHLPPQRPGLGGQLGLSLNYTDGTFVLVEPN